MSFFNHDNNPNNPEMLTVLEYIHKKKRLKKKIENLVEEKKPIEDRIKKVEEELAELERTKPPLKYVVKYRYIGHIDFGMYPSSFTAASRIFNEKVEWKESKFMTIKGAKKFIDTIKENHEYSFIKILKP